MNPPSRRPANWKSAAPAPPAGTTTFSVQSSLPRLTVLPLAPTLDTHKRGRRACAAQLKGDASEEELKALEIDVTGKIMLAS